MQRVTPFSLTVCLLVAACQPQARRVLLLDLALADPVVLESTARPWREAGYTVHYRRFYPHLTLADREAHHVLVLLGGSEPERSSDRLSLGDLAELSAWVLRGGVVVFGYDGDGEGFFDRWMMNRWLESHGAGIVIGDYPLHDSTRAPGGSAEPQPPATPRRGVPLHDPGFDPFPAGRNHVLLVDHERRVLARSSDAAFVRPPAKEPEARPRAAVVAASRVGPGLVVVASRHALATPGPDLRPATRPLARAGDDRAARTFLHALARWTRRPAEWAAVPPARGGGALALAEAPLPPVARAPRAAPPPGVGTLLLRGPSAEDRTGPVVRAPAWIAGQGMRVFWGDLQAAAAFQPASARARELDALLAFLEAGAFGALAASPPPATLTDTARFQPWEVEYAAAAVRQLVERLETSSVRWIPVIRPAALRVPVDSPARGMRGDSLPLWCALRPELWTRALGPAYRAVARLAAAKPELVPAVVLDLSLPGGGYTMGHDYCDATYTAALAAMELDGPRAAALAAVPLEARYDSLLDAGLLEPYYATLERLVAARAAALRRDTRALAPGLVLGLKNGAAPADWFTLGLLLGLSGDGPPLILWTREPDGRGLASVYRRRGIVVLHATALAPAAVAAGGWPRLHGAVFRDNDGFWVPGEPGTLGPATDSVAHLIRRLSR